MFLVTVYQNDSNRVPPVVCAFYFCLMELGNLESNSRASRSVTRLCAETVVTNFSSQKHDCQCRLWFNAAKMS